MSSNTFVSVGSQSMVSELNIPSIHPMTANLSTHMSVPEEKSDVLNYIFHQYWQTEGCPNVLHLPLLGGGPLSTLVIMIAYLLFVIRIGPWFMSRRPAYELRQPMLIYNTLMVVFNAYFFFKFISISDYGREYLKFQFPNTYDNSPREQDIIQTAYLYFLTKFVDLLDTVFFVLRKRDRQVSGLHLYHHTIVPLLGYLTMKIMPTIPGYQVFGLLNSFVHTIMYSYYALAAFGPSIQPYLWWKKYITQIQIIQFLIFIGYTVVLGKFQTGYPAIWLWTAFVQSPLFFYMFTDFYIKSYRRTKANKIR